MWELRVTNPDGSSYQEFYRRNDVKYLMARIAELLTYDKEKFEVIYPPDI